MAKLCYKFWMSLQSNYDIAVAEENAIYGIAGKP